MGVVDWFGDPEFELFVAGDGPRQLALARALCRNEQDAWDLAQDTLARAGQHWGSIRRRDDPVRYARRTMINLNLSRVRGVVREWLTASSPDVPGDDGSALEAVGIKWLSVALAELPGKQRAAVTLAYVEDLSVAQIAELLGCSIGAAKTHLSRGCAALRAAAPKPNPDASQGQYAQQGSTT